MVEKSKEKIKEEVEEEEWDKTRVIIGGILLLLVVVGGFLGKNYILGWFGINDKPIPFNRQSVQGAQTINVPSDSSQAVPHIQYSLPSTTDVTNKVQELQKQVSNINIADVASSSPQIQQVIEQLKALPQMPGNAAKEACINVCNKL